MHVLNMSAIIFRVLNNNFCRVFQQFFFLIFTLFFITNIGVAVKFGISLNSNREKKLWQNVKSTSGRDRTKIKYDELNLVCAVEMAMNGLKICVYRASLRNK